MEELVESLGGSVKRLICFSSPATRLCNCRMISITSGFESCCNCLRVMAAAGAS